MLSQRKAYLQAIARHWVARYGAYPVMWTPGRRNAIMTFYAETAHNKHAWATEHNPWIDVAEYIHTCEHTGTDFRAPGGSVVYYGNGKRNDGGKSQQRRKIDVPFAGNYISYRPRLVGGAMEAEYQRSPNFSSAKDYWASPKVGINYEDRYAYLWTKDFGAPVYAAAELFKRLFRLRLRLCRSLVL